MLQPGGQWVGGRVVEGKGVEAGGWRPGAWGWRQGAQVPSDYNLHGAITTTSTGLTCRCRRR